MFKFCVDDLRKLLSDKDHTINFCFHLIRSRYKIIVVSYFILIRDELRKETLQLASEGKSGQGASYSGATKPVPDIRTTELAAAQEKLNELERKKEEMLRPCSPASLLHKLEEAKSKTDDESESGEQIVSRQGD
ncbi:Vacuolar protein-sorting-associated protein 37 homolog 1 [Linum perenne]